ncbi:type IV secretory system conjugative DNA transfer family protein (plasmid) [Pseudosulfitobacter pseudonitzschiae]|nr:type IV secretory system conjugative DNA transfer family protein [Pseudosulfitobacter pseudonitzschiae]UFE30822.1 type IV secretory system conjugative DNA transfer family protein [Pseudosulfitobacter pseudonitzschiae]UFE35532.1 type IV secretory system conjugative DNA transfer family protein [Pseudosulfitobacter pseudonitzschiae]UFE40074.1 type IV secretory system conjugative DNA transfer family protein [Pseudosulfitobacter pseudonitzschiae]UFE44720.1 type IV secretory system conjugative DNA
MFLCSNTFPHALIVSPTSPGKTTGFVIPNLGAFPPGSSSVGAQNRCA